MGNWNSIINKIKEEKKPNSKLQRNIPNKQDEYKDLEIELLKSAIANDPDSFILNNLMMCIQFFENYEE